jgi:primosomal protein N' (replication factor Y) (superfamily II helicase)
MAGTEKYASVILDVSIDKTLDYEIPPDLIGRLKRGMRVKVPLNGQLRGGYVYDLKITKSYPKLQPIKEVVSDQEFLTPDLFEIALWISNYYYAPLSKVLKVMLPASVRKEVKPKEQLYVMRKHTREDLKAYCIEIRNRYPAQAAVIDEMLQVSKGILLTELLEKTGGTRSPVDTLAKKGMLALDIIRIDRSPLVDEEYFLTKSKKLNHDQKESLDAIKEDLDKENFRTHLLYGVTGSGKTEVYLQAIQHALAQGKGAIVLVPEISLTEQTIDRFRSRFKDKIAVLHHRLSHGERYDSWIDIANGKAKIVIGARSAIFSPVQNLGLIIVDEEHESSYKQSDESPSYHARDVAVMRGKITGSAVILGSATPSIESYTNALNGKYHLSKLHLRAGASTTAKVSIVDMNREYERAKGFTNFSEPLIEAIKARHAAGEQAILFLNRRGYHTTLFCQKCRKGISCLHCDQTLTYHHKDNALCCHLCGFTLAPPPRECPGCKDPNLMKFKGVGTELLEKSLKAILPEIRTIRVDADTTKHKGSQQQLLRQFRTGKADVLIGTQMVAKGLHFPEVTLVGVINCDSSLNIPDFRASETVFQLITQVAGRAGRGVMPGAVILQTCMPDNSTIQHAANQDFFAFYEEEITIRKLFGFPPFSQMVKITFSGPDEAKTRAMAEGLRSKLLSALSSSFHLHPVSAAGHAKVKDRWRFQFLVRGSSTQPVTQTLHRISWNVPSNYRLFVNVNPLSTFF